MCHNDGEVSRIAFEVGELLIDIDNTEGNGDISDVVMKQKFEIYNKEWIEVVCKEGNSDSVYYDNDINGGQLCGLSNLEMDLSQLGYDAGYDDGYESDNMIQNN